MSDNEAAFGVNGEPIEENTDTAKCPACGAQMVFSPEKQQLECPYCGCLKAVDFSKAGSELAFAELMKNRNGEWGSETHVFRCNNCGAKEVIERTDIAKQCSFCGTTNVTQVEELSGLRPNAVVPFAIDVKEASQNVVTWAKKKIFAPRAFKQSVKPEKIKGTYMPAFTFDSQTHTRYGARLGKYYTRTRNVNGRTETYRELRYFTVSGDYNMWFDDVLIQAGKRISQRDLNKLSPFHTQESNAYSSEFLHGYTAQSNEKSGEECWEEAKNIMFEQIKSAVLSQYEYDVVDSYSPYTTYSNVTFKYVLLPVYVGHCNWKTKLYNFFVNGKNGRVTGKTPVSAWRVAFAVLLGIVVIGGIIWGINLLAG